MFCICAGDSPRMVLMTSMRGSSYAGTFGALARTTHLSFAYRWLPSLVDRCVPLDLTLSYGNITIEDICGRWLTFLSRCRLCRGSKLQPQRLRASQCSVSTRMVAERRARGVLQLAHRANLPHRVHGGHNLPPLAESAKESETNAETQEIDSPRQSTKSTSTECSMISMSGSYRLTQTDERLLRQ